jgi:hypothetical protein
MILFINSVTVECVYRETLHIYIYVTEYIYLYLFYICIHRINILYHIPLSYLTIVWCGLSVKYVDVCYKKMIGK